MTSKLNNIKEGLGEIKKIDNEIIEFLENEKYQDILDKLKDRLNIISQITILKERDGIDTATEKKIQEIFSEGSILQKKILEKRDKIGGRLNKRKKLVSQNKSFGY